MKKIVTLILLFISTISFGQNKEYKKAVNLFNDKKYTEANVIIEKLLNKEYGDLDEITELYVLNINVNCYIYTNDNKMAYSKALVYVDFIKNSKKVFVDDTSKNKAIADTEKIVDDLKTKVPKESYSKSETNIVSESSTATTTDNSESKVLETTKPASDDKTVTLTVSGTGKTLEEARLNALRSAIEQAFGAFISSKTEILNDNLIKDEIISVSNGNIEKYNIISQLELPNHGFSIILNTTVSLSKLTSFAESKGVVIEFKGGMFAVNIKLQKIQEALELIAIKNICEASYNILRNSLDYSILVKDPVVIGNETHDRTLFYLASNADYGKLDINNVYDYNYSEKYGIYIDKYSKDDFYIDFEVKMLNNANYNNFVSYFETSIKALSISEEEMKNRINLSKEGGVVEINNNKYYLKNSSSLDILNKFILKSNLIPYFFKISSNVRNFPFIYKYQYNNECKIDLINADFYIPEENTYLDYDRIEREIYNNNLFENYNDSIFEKIKLMTPKIRFDLQLKNITFFIREYFKLSEIESIDKFEIIPLDIDETINIEKLRISKIKKVKIFDQIQNIEFNNNNNYPQVYSDFFGKEYKYNMKIDHGGDDIGNYIGRFVELIEIKDKKALIKIYNAEFKREYKNDLGYEFTFEKNNKPGELFYVPIEWISDKPVKH
jgi:hypothetical protein